MPADQSPPPLHVLLVEDSVVNQKLLIGILQRRGVDVIVAENGEEGLREFDQRHFDLVLMDIQMPVMDGLQATQMIRHRESISGKHTPIVAVTAGVDRDTCMAAGMDGFLQKPVRPNVLWAMISDVTGCFSD